MFGSLGSVGGVSAGASLTASALGFQASAAANTTIATLSQPFGAGTTYSIVGTTPGQLVLSGANVLVGATASVAGTTYPLMVRATTADGKRDDAETFVFSALAATATIANTLTGSTVLGSAVSDFMVPAQSLDTRLAALGA